MATYKDIHGQNIPIRASDPSNPVTGEVWYNSTTNILKVIEATSAGAWATGGALPGARQYAGLAGIQTAAIFAGGQSPGAYNNNTSYTYDGSSWTSTPALQVDRRQATMMGTQASALLGGSGTSPPSTAITASEEWDGSNWSVAGVMNTARYGNFSGGTQTQAVCAGGSGPATYFDDTEEYNGTSWTTVTNMPGNQGGGTSGADLQTDMYCVAGGPGNKTTSVVYDGTNWTSGASLSGDGRRGTGGAMATSSNPGFVTCGETATTNPISVTEEWNGTAFSSSTACPTAHRDQATGDGGTGAAGIVAGGYSTAISANVFEWTGSGVQQTKTITSS